MTRRIVAVALLSAAVMGLFVGMGIGLFQSKPPGAVRAADVNSRVPAVTDAPAPATETPTPTPTQTVGPKRDVAYVVINGANGQAADVAGANKENGTPVILFERHGQANQQWIVKDAGSGFVFLVSADSGKCLQMRRLSRRPGATAVVSDCSGREGQRWQFAVDQDGWSLTSSTSGLRLDASDDLINGIRRLVQKQPEENARSQVWYFNPVG